MENLYVIAGLGNPGRKYAATRHNAGFMVVDKLAQRWHSSWLEEKKFHARVAWAEPAQKKVLLCQPLTYMNASGEAVGAIAAYYQVKGGHLLVVVDDADLPLGCIRLRSRGSSGGHHGLESVGPHLGGWGFPRLRVGIGRQAGGGREITDYVLSRFSAQEAELLEKVLTRACDQIECWLQDGIAKAMSQFNGVLTVP